MRRILDDLVQDIPDFPAETVITVGNFDGVHLGHRRLIEKTCEIARVTGLTPVILTFFPHSTDLVPGKQTQKIYPQIQKQALIEEIAPEAVYVQMSCTRNLIEMQESDFFYEMLLGRYHGRGFVVGDDFHYGYRGAGDHETLKEHARAEGLQVEIIPQVSDGGERISSTRIRGLLKEGRIEEADRLLKRPYHIEGVVSHGKRLGRRLGFPTVNLFLEEGLEVPKHGVYRTTVHTPDGIYAGVTNVGINPTVEHSNRIKVETYLLDYDGDLYSKTIRVELIRYLRPEVRFDNIEQLRQQLNHDINTVRLETSK